MNQSTRLYFIALLPPAEIQEQITKIKQYFADNYASSHALTSPPHITLQPPFRWLPSEIPILEEDLSQFALTAAPVPVSLDGFGAFPPRVIYVRPQKTPELMEVQRALAAYLETNLGLVDEKEKQRAFSPHITVAFRDLKRQAFKAAWPEFQERPLKQEFVATHLTLLIHDRGQWHIETEFPFGGQNFA